MEEVSKNIEEEKEEIKYETEIELFFKNGKLINNEELGTKELFFQNVHEIIEKNLKLTNNYFLIFESFWFKDITFTELLKKIILEKNPDLKLECFYMNYLFITYDGLVYEKYKCFEKSQILQYLVSKSNTGFTVDLMDPDEDDILMNNNDLSDEDTPIIGKKVKYKLPVIKRITINSITHNSVTIRIPKVPFIEFREKNSLYREDDKDRLKYIILLYDRESKKFQIKENSYFRENFLILDLIPDSFNIVKIVLFYEDGNSYGKPSRPFYFFTKSCPNTPNYSFYSWGSNKYNISFSQSEEKTNEIRAPLKFPNNDINQIDGNNDNIYLVNTRGFLISSCKTYCDDNGNDDFTETSSLKIKNIFVNPFKLRLKDLYVKKIACGQDSLVILSNTGKLYSMGLNDAGQLGLNYPNDIFINSPKELKFPDLNDFVMDIAAGDKHYIALVRNIELNIYTWGINQGLEPIDIGINMMNALDLRQSKIPLLKADFLNKNIIKIHAKGYYSAVLTLEKISDNKFRRNVYTFGQNSSMLGNIDIFGVPYINISRIVESLKEKDVIDISFGETHTLFLVNYKDYISKEELSSKTYTGNVYGCGSCKHGELGFTSDMNLAEPKLINNCPPNIKGISAGKFNSVLLDSNNDIIFYGKKSASFCGNPNFCCVNSVETNSYFRENKINIEKIINGDNYCFAITK
jgi:alpha-tubulin suppressor-like RCC1 family protein